MRHRERRTGFAVIACVLALLLYWSSDPAVVDTAAASNTAVPAFQTDTSRNCPKSAPARAGNLPPGTHRGGFTLRGFANRPGAKERAMVTLEGTLTVNVAADGQWRDSTAEVTFSLQGVGQPSVETISGTFTDAEGTLRQQHDTAGRQFSVEGLVAGEALAFVRDLRGKDKNPSQRSATGGDARIDFTTSDVLCASANGIATSPLMEETLKGLAAQGMETSGGPGRWFLAPGGTRDGGRVVRSNVMAVEQAVAEGLAMGTEAAGPQRRMAESRFARIREEIDGSCPADPGHCLLCFKECPGPDERECMSRIWYDGYVKAMSRWLEQELAIIRKTNVGAPESPVYASSAMNYDGLHPYLVEALTLDRQLALMGVDVCTREMQVSVFQDIGDALARLVQRMIREKRPPRDVLSVDREVHMLGTVSPPAAKTAFDYVRETARNERDTLLADLKARAKPPINNNWDTCIPDNARLWALAVNAERQMAMMGSNSRDVLTYFDSVKPRDSKPGCQ